MAKITFGGRRKTNGEWVEGSLIYWHGESDRPCIETEVYEVLGQWRVNAYEVEPESVTVIHGTD